MMMVLVNRLFVVDLICAQRVRLGLGSVDDGYWPMLDDCGYNGNRGERYWRRGNRLWHEIHHGTLKVERGAVRVQGRARNVYKNVFYDSAR